MTASRAADVLEYFAPTKTQVAAAIEWHDNNGTEKAWLEYLIDNHLAELCLSAGIELKEKEVRKKYREAIVAERLTGMPADPEPRVSYDMKWGIANESIARNVYQLEHRLLITDAPFIEHKDPKVLAGASPDGWVVDPKTGEVVASTEIKCLRSANHLYKTIMTQTVPPEHIPQIQMQMWINGMPKVVFIAYDSRVPEGLKIFVTEVQRDERYIKVLEASILRFLQECDNDFKHFWAMVKKKPRLERGVIVRNEDLER